MRVGYTSRFTGYDRVDFTLYGNICGHEVARWVRATDSIDMYFSLLRCKFAEYVSMERDYKDRVSSILPICTFIKMSTLGISTSHRAIMDCLSDIFHIKWCEVRVHISRNARVFDVCGGKFDMLSFIPVFMYTVSVYDLYSGEYIRSLKGIPTAQKREARRRYTMLFCEKIKLLWESLM